MIRPLAATALAAAALAACSPAPPAGGPSPAASAPAAGGTTGAAGFDAGPEAADADTDAGAADADAGSDAEGAGAGAGAAAARGPAAYPYEGRHSPMTASVVANLKAILARGEGRRDVFAKVGDSITVSGAFLSCLDGDDVRWGTHEALKETHDFFAKTPADEKRSSFSRVTQSARVGWRTIKVLEGRHPLERELREVRPGWAVVMLGTNDTFPDAMQGYHQALGEVIDTMTARGVVPLMSTIPPRRDSLKAIEQTAEMNAVVRLVARTKQVPLMDLFGALDGLPGAGLIRDGVHPDAYKDDRYHPCWFDERGLKGGMNQRNLLVLEALDRARRLVLGGAPPEADPAPPAGDGTWKTPFELAVPGVFRGDTRGGDEQATSYGCGKGELAGPERVFKVKIERAGRLRVRAFHEASEAGLRWLTGPDPRGCTGKAHTRLDVAVKPGVYWLLVDAPSRQKAGIFGLTALLTPTP